MCDKLVPSVVPTSGNFLNPDQDIANTVRLVTERANKVELLVKKNFPNLYQYVNIPEYAQCLQQYGQTVRNAIFQQNQQEINRLDMELNEQKMRNEREINQYKEYLQRQLNNYQPPGYR